MIYLEQDHCWIIAIYKEKTLRDTKERLRIILGLCEDDPNIRELVQDTIRLLSQMSEEEFQALDLPVIPQEA